MADEKAKTEKNDNVVFVGNKPSMNYVLAVITQFHNNIKKVEIKARGRAISRAVDVAEITRNKFLPDVKVSKIEISTEKVTDRNNEEANVSAINIVLGK